MNIAKLYSRALIGMDAPQVIVEVHVANGLPSFSIVGLADTEVKESRDRVRSAIQNSGFEFPARRITVNLAPADLPKDSARYDLPIALGILIAANLVKPVVATENFEFAGELALDGELRPIKGALAIAFGASKTSRTFILPTKSANEAALIEELTPLAAPSLVSVINHLLQVEQLFPAKPKIDPINEHSFSFNDLAQVKGQVTSKKALEIAAAGRHSLLMIGNPGSGKTMLASRITSILPKLNNQEAIVSASIHSLTNTGFKLENWLHPPFRSPHHNTTKAALVGGGTIPKPGEISLAHNGVLFLDELPEFDRNVLEVLREPLETKKISIARANYKIEYHADFQLIAAMNPCPCGNLAHPIKSCNCSVEQINRYRAKISGPLLDRIDMVVEVPILKPHELKDIEPGECSETIANRVNAAREIQYKRQGKLNYALLGEEINDYCTMNHGAEKLLQQIVEKNGLSARSYYRIIKLSRTIADLANEHSIETKHIALASQYKSNHLG